MAAEQRRLLAQLMGDQLMNSGSSAQRASLTITDPKVCRSYLCGACPHDLFTNTKQDLGPCPLAHQPNHKEEWLAASDEKKQEWGFEFDYQRDMTRHVAECDRKIEVLQRRLEKTAEEIKQTNALLKSITDFERTIATGLLEIEILAEEGAVNLAVQEFHKLKLVRVQKEDKERELKTLSDTSGPSGHQKLQVCDVCGAYLSRLDNDRRLADHFFGKMHLGYAQMRKECERLAKELKGRPAPVRDEPMNDGPPARYGEEGYGERGSNYGGGYGRGGRNGGYGGGRGGRSGGYGGGGGGGSLWHRCPRWRRARPLHTRETISLPSSSNQELPLAKITPPQVKAVPTSPEPRPDSRPSLAAPSIVAHYQMAAGQHRGPPN
nr:u1 snrnp-associated protein [Quercus suber]